MDGTQEKVLAMSVRSGILRFQTLSLQTMFHWICPWRTYREHFLPLTF